MLTFHVLTYIASPITQLLKHFLKTLKVISLDELSNSTRIPPYLDALIEAGPESMLHYAYVFVCVCLHYMGYTQGGQRAMYLP